MKNHQQNQEKLRRQYSLFLNELGKCKGLEERQKIEILQAFRNGQRAIIEIVQEFSIYKNYKRMESKFKNVLKKPSVKINRNQVPQKSNEKQVENHLLSRVFSLNLLKKHHQSSTIHKKSMRIDVDLIRRSQQLKKTFSPRYNSAKAIKHNLNPINQDRQDKKAKPLYSIQSSRRYSDGNGIRIISPFCQINENYLASTMNIAKNRLKSKKIAPKIIEKIKQNEDNIFSFEIYPKNPQSSCCQKSECLKPIQGHFYQRIREIIDSK